MKLFIKIQGKILGPLEWEKILKTADKGRLAADVMVSDDQVNWLSIEETRKLLKQKSQAKSVFKQHSIQYDSIFDTYQKNDSKAHEASQLEWTETSCSGESQAKSNEKTQIQMDDARDGSSNRMRGENSQRFSFSKYMRIGMVILLGACIVGLSFFLNQGISSSKDNKDKKTTGEPLTSRQIDELVTPSVLAVLVETASGWCTGSGIPVTERDVLTNRHVVEEIGEGGEVLVYNEKWDDPRGGKLHKKSSTVDLAWIVMNDSLPVKPLKISKNKSQRGDNVYAYGYPGYAYDFGKENTKVRGTSGQISAVDLPEKGTLHYEHTAAVNHGNSGGPLFNDHGEVVGVNTWIIENTNSSFFAIEISELKKVFPRLWNKAY